MQKKFRIGLTMAGAVSAGAYTGGVLDYLFQTLDAWTKAKEANDSSVPTHDISLDIISGASAGGITGGMAALALHLENRNPAIPIKRGDQQYLKENIFYNAWVNLLQDDMIQPLLSLTDIDKNEKAVSLLNSEFIEEIAKRTIIKVPECTTAPPSYVSKQMELILTLSNLDGFTYELNFSSEGSSKHLMKQHRDYAFFRLGDIYGGDGRIPLNLQKDDVGLTELLQAAPATGAFPIGLAYRKFVRKKKYILDNKDLVYYQTGITRIKDIEEEDPEGEYVTYNVDGGMLNNEPFDLTMKLMAKTSANNNVAEKQELLKEENEFDSTIIMIDPFPSDDSVLETDELSQEDLKSQKAGDDVFKQFPYGIKEVASKILASMRGELLFKGEDIVRAFSQKDFSRFMIAPRRREKYRIEGLDKERVFNGSIAIACGALGGFSGFFDKNFRQHDFFLGRANCQSFLRKYFRVKLDHNTIPVNPIFRAGYSKEAIERFKFQDQNELEKDPTLANWYVPIIPDVYKENNLYTEQALDYPRYDISKFDQHKKPALKRFKTIAKSSAKTWFSKLLVEFAFMIKGNFIFNKLRSMIQKQFELWRIIR